MPRLLRYSSSLLVISLLFLPFVTSSQKEDNIWLLGYNEERIPEDSSFGGINLNFNFQPREVEYIKRGNDFWHTNASICDSDGNLIFFTNGIYIGNKNYDIMENGEDINEWDNDGYGLRQGAIVLPFPGHDDQYYTFQGEWKYHWTNGNSRVVMRELRYSTIDMNNNNDLGIVLSKNNIISKTFMNSGFITACQNGNGRDWWLPIVKLDSDSILLYNLDIGGLSLHGTFVSETKILNGLGSAFFTPDGTKYLNVKGIIIYDGYYIDIFDFDRCTGELSNHIHFYDDPIMDTTYQVNASISSNSRYLYVSNTWNVFQYDLQAVDIQGSRITVAKWDGFIDFSPTVFDKMQLAPDNKIYISPPGSSHSMHVIHAPDSAGVACRVEQHAIKLPAWNNGTIPNFPHFRMGRLKGSPCDTLTANLDPISTSKQQAFLDLYPNPVQSELSIGWKDGFNFVDNMTIHLYNTLGDEVNVAPILNKNMTIDVAYFTNGLYIYTIVRKGHIMQKGKIVVE